MSLMKRELAPIPAAAWELIDEEASQDLSIGYADHGRDEVELFLAESFTFRVLEPAAAVRLRHAESSPDQEPP